MRALLFMVFLLAGQPLAHDADGNPDPPPVTCDQRCKAVQCDCVEACKKLGATVHPSCFSDCFDQRVECHTRCQPMIRSAP